ncbi:MAG TPA: TolC family protein [Bryobacteraceae bacterium]|jgi:outer membrane protein TolC|nr:TolC family protein [Bryobacteraceae bacterium]
MNKIREAALFSALSLLLVLHTTVLRGQSSSQSGGASGGSGAGGIQTGGSGVSSSQSSGQITATPQMGDPKFQGSVPQGQATSATIPLSFGTAIKKGLQTNLGLLTSEESSREIRAQRLRALSTLLPKVTGQVGATEQQINLQAVGFLFHFPGINIPSIIGPYNYEIASANVSAALFDFSAISNFKASKEETKASVLTIKNARDLVVQAVGNAYLQIIADAARITATQAEIEADRAVYINATLRHDAGTAIAIDVLRSEVELKQRQQQLVAVSNQFEKDKLTLGRVIGLPVGQDFSVADPSPAVPLTAISVSEALSKAYEHRPDYQAAKARVLAARFTLRGAKAERYPTLYANGFYGAEGLGLFSNSHGVFNATATLQFNIFDGGRIKSDILQNDAELRNRSNELENLRGQIDLEVRSALLDLNSAHEQVDVAQTNLQLATETVKQARDRFSAGVTNTVEVVQAQQSLADANENLISAQFQYNLAKVSLARSLGLAEESIGTYFANQP